MFLEIEITSGEYSISTDKSKLNIELVHDFLSKSYWAMDIPKAVVKNAVRHSLCFGVYRDDQQVGFARVISDFSTFAYMADVFVLEEHRGKGLGKLLVETMIDHPDLLRMPRWMLLTKDANDLYQKMGFARPEKPERIMERLDPTAFDESA